MIVLYVDDIPAACNCAPWLSSFKVKLSARFEIKDLSDLSQLMGIHITRDRSACTISLDQSNYLRDMLAKHGMSNNKPSSLPVDLDFMSGLAHMDSPPLTGVAKDVYPASSAASNTQRFARLRMSPRLLVSLDPLRHIPQRLTSGP
jgi:hypothetical protein